MLKKLLLTVVCLYAACSVSAFANTTCRACAKKTSSAHFMQLPGYVAFMQKTEKGDLIYTWANANLMKAAGTNLINKTNTDESVAWHADGKRFDLHDWFVMHKGHEKAFVEVRNKGQTNREVVLAYIAPVKDGKGDVTGVSKVMLPVTPNLLKELNAVMGHAQHETILP